MLRRRPAPPLTGIRYSIPRTRNLNQAQIHDRQKTLPASHCQQRPPQLLIQVRANVSSCPWCIGSVFVPAYSSGTTLFLTGLAAAGVDMLAMLQAQSQVMQIASYAALYGGQGFPGALHFAPLPPSYVLPAQVRTSDPSAVLVASCGQRAAAYCISSVPMTNSLSSTFLGPAPAVVMPLSTSVGLGMIQLWEMQDV